MSIPIRRYSCEAPPLEHLSKRCSKFRNGLRKASFKPVKISQGQFKDSTDRPKGLQRTEREFLTKTHSNAVARSSVVRDGGTQLRAARLHVEQLHWTGQTAEAHTTSIKYAAKL